MVQQLFTRSTCDWHGNLDEPQTVEAVHVRINPLGKKNDLCEACAMVFDFLLPRREGVLQLLHAEVIERLFRAGREADDKPRDRVPAQLAIPAAVPVSEKEQSRKQPAAKPSTGQQSVANRGRWVDGEEQVRCPLDHRGANSPDEYWVKLRDRHSHAGGSHGLMGPEIAYELLSEGSLTLDYKCFEHKVCVDNGGYGHKTKSALATHIYKANVAGWEPAPSTDATATADAA